MGSRALLVAAVVLAVALRVYFLPGPFIGPQHTNEGHYAATALNFGRYGLLIQANEFGLDFTFSPLVPWLAALSAHMFGWSEWALRMPSLAFGLLSVAVVWGLAPLVPGGERCRPLAVFLAACTPVLVYFSARLQLEATSTFFAVAGLWAFERGRRERSARMLTVSGACWVVAVFAKYSMGVYPLALLAAPFSDRDRRNVRYSAVAAGAVVAAAAMIPFAWMKLWPTLMAGRVAELTAKGLGGGIAQSNFLLRPGAWSAGAVAQALLSIPAGALLTTGLVLPGAILGMIRFGRRENLVLLVFSWCWLLFAVTHPASVLVSPYYWYPAALVWCCWAAMGFVWLAEVAGARLSESRLRSNALDRLIPVGGVGVILLVALALLNSQYNRSGLSKAYRAMQPPFAPAVYRAQHYSRLRTLVEEPSALYYAGGDPMTISSASYLTGAKWLTAGGRDGPGDGGVAPWIRSNKFDVIIWNAFRSKEVSPESRRALQESRYEEVQPMLFVKKGTQRD